MSTVRIVFLLTLVVAVSCGGSSKSGGGGSFQLIEFLTGGLSEIERNSALEFRFSAPVAPDQDFSERLRVQNIQSGQAGSDMTKAIGHYLVSAEVVLFVPRLPEMIDRSDAGFRALGNYHVFLKAGPDSLQSTSGDRISQQQEYVFDTSEYFEDPIPNDPPRAIRFLAVDPTNGTTTDISRADPRPDHLAVMDNAELFAKGKVIEPGAGSDYKTFWNFELEITEPLDPSGVNVSNIEMWEIRGGVFESPPDTIGQDKTGELLVPAYRVPIATQIEQRFKGDQGVCVTIRVIPKLTLIDNARYRIHFRGNILGIDYRKAFSGTNGLTGDGQTLVETPGGDVVYSEIGGLGYVTEFLVYDRPGIDSGRTLLYEPLMDGINPEYGQTLDDPEDKSRFNTSLYDSSIQPGTAVGAVPAFGNGVDGDLSVTVSGISYLDTGDEPNDVYGNPFDVVDVDPEDQYANTDSNMPAPGIRTFNSYQPTEWNFVNVTIGSAATLRIIGVNPARFRVQGLVTVIGRIDAGGDDGQDGLMGTATRNGGGAGPAGFVGGDAKAGLLSCYVSSCCTAASFDRYLSGCPTANQGFPFSLKGKGPGRGHEGGELYSYDYYDATQLNDGKISGTGGGGGGHSKQGENGQDLRNANGAYGTAGPAYDSTLYHKNSSLIGVRGAGGAKYGDTEILDILAGGSGGGAGGSAHIVYYGTSSGSGGAGGGGGGTLEIYAAGDILLPGGTIDVSGGDGGKGMLVSTYSYKSPFPLIPTGAGGGGSGGTLSLISGGDINVAAGIIEARGGTGGRAAHIGTSVTCSACNEGGDGSTGLVLLMDQDGVIEGMLNNTVGEYDRPDGYITIRKFRADRFGPMQACTELFHVGTADPRYQDIQPGDVMAGLDNEGQWIDLYASSAKASLNDPLSPDPNTETTPVLVAQLRHVSGGVEVNPIQGAMAALNPVGDEERRAFIRVIGYFEYHEDQQLQAATGPYAYLDEVAVRVRFNE